GASRCHGIPPHRLHVNRTPDGPELFGGSESGKVRAGTAPPPEPRAGDRVRTFGRLAPTTHIEGRSAAGVDTLADPERGSHVSTVPALQSCMRPVVGGAAEGHPPSGWSRPGIVRVRARAGS